MREHSAVGLVPLVAVARERGLDADVLLRGAGIAPTVVADATATVAAERVHALVRLLLERTGDPTLGLAAGRHYNLATFGLLGAVAAVTPSPRDVVRLFVQYQHLTFTYFLVELDEKTDHLLFVSDEDLGPLHRFYLDRELSFVFRTARRLWPTSYRQLVGELLFDYPEPPEAASYRSYFGVPLRFSAEIAAARIDFGAEPPPSTLNPLGNSELERQLASFGAVETDIVERTRRAVMTSVATRQHLPTIEEIAAVVGRSARTLRRELDGRGTSVRDITDEVVATLATRYLRDQTLSVDTIAERLGYAEASSFLRAFRRITGRSITSVRR